jgi:uncharacterized protein YegL
LRQAQAKNRVLVFPVAIGPAAGQELKKASDRPVVQIKAAKFTELFKFISYASQSASTSPAGTQQDMALWGTVVP